MKLFLTAFLVGFIARFIYEGLASIARIIRDSIDDPWSPHDEARPQPPSPALRCGFSKSVYWCTREPHADGPCACPYPAHMTPFQACFTDESPFNRETR